MDLTVYSSYRMGLTAVCALSLFLSVLLLVPNSRTLASDQQAMEIAFDDLVLDLASLGGKKIKVRAVVSCVIAISQCALYPAGSGGLRKPLFLNLKHTDRSVRRTLYNSCTPQRGGCPVEVTGMVATGLAINGNIDVFNINFTR